MPVDPEKSIEKKVLYPDDLPGEGFVVREYLYYESNEVEEDDAQFGMWLPVKKVGIDEELWMNAPRNLRERLVRLDVEEGDAFRVLEAERGPADHDPWEFEIEYPYES